MTVVGSTEKTRPVGMEKFAIEIEEVRTSLMDFAENNKPLYVEDLTDPDIFRCMVMVVNDFNETPPILARYQFTLENFPYKFLLNLGATAFALELVALKELRGEMSFDDGGVANSQHYKQGHFNQYAVLRKQEYTQLKRNIKVSLNKNQCWATLR